MSKSIISLLLLALAVCGAAAEARNGARINSRKLLDFGAFCWPLVSLWHTTLELPFCCPSAPALPCAGSFAQADAFAAARSFFDDWGKGNRRAPTTSECEAAASASASSFSFGDGFGALSAARAAADASAGSRGSNGWKGAFLSACKASASASAESGSFGGSEGGSFSGDQVAGLRLGWHRAAGGAPLCLTHTSVCTPS